MTEVPQYRVLETSFFAPNMVQKGSIIRYLGTPGNNLEPLNDAARARMEEWFGIEVPEYDERGIKTGGTISPREKFRMKPYEASIHHVPEVLATPAPEVKNVKTLAELQASRKATDQRPPAEEASNIQTVPTALGLEVLEAAPPPPSTVKKTA